MRDSRPMKAEHRVQLSFTKPQLLQILTLILAILLFAAWRASAPDREEIGWRASAVRFDPVALDPRGFTPLRLAGAWRVTSEDPRFGGISALAVSGGAFVAVTDTGVVARLPKPAQGKVQSLIGELPGGPADPRFKANRDAEAIIRDPLGRGWWIAFETRNELWLYDAEFKRTLGRMRFGRDRWPRNRGIEAAATERDLLLLLPEYGNSVVELRGKEMRVVPIRAPAGRISDVARLPSGELLMLNRRMTPFGFANSVAALERAGGAYRYGPRIHLGLGLLDNAEALAPEPLPHRGTRLWLMTDDGFQRPFRTLLIALDMLPRPRARRQPS